MIEKFEIRGVNWLRKRSPNIGEDDWSVVGIASLEVKCKRCEFEWIARRGDGRGQFDGGVGAIGLTCVKCDNDETISTRELGKLFPYER